MRSDVENQRAAHCGSVASPSDHGWHAPVLGPASTVGVSVSGGQDRDRRRLRLGRTRPEVVVDFNWLAAEMRSSCTGAAPGLSGWGSNYLQVLAADPHCVHALAHFIGRIVNNNLPADIRSMLTTSFVVSLEKADSNGRRPIAIGDMFVRIAARYALCLVTKAAQRAMRPYQFGAGQPDGATQIVQSVQHLLSAPCTSTAAPRPLACLRVDLTNAFNAIDRAAVLRAVYSRPELKGCWRTVAFGYGQPSRLLMQCGETVPDSEAFIESQMGVRQGDPLAAMLFSLAMHPVYETAARMSSGGCYAYSDDSNTIGTLEECWMVWQRLPGLLRDLGLSLNLSKCDLTCFQLSSVTTDADKAALRAFRDEGMTVNERWVRVLGCVIGSDDDCIQDALRSDPYFRSETSAAFRRLPRMYYKADAMLLLRQLSGQVITNRLRAVPPAATLEHAAAYDRGVLRVAHSLVGITRTDGDRYDQQLQASLSMGGFGLTSAAALAPAAYIAGAEVTMRLSPAFAEEWSGARPLSPSCRQFGAISDCLLRIEAAESALRQQCDAATLASTKVPDSVLPDTASDFVRHFSTLPPTAIQQAASYRISTLGYIARASACVKAGKAGVEQLARLRALRMDGASEWLTVMPTEAGLRLINPHFQWAARLRLGTPVPAVSDVCGGCRKPDTGGDWHALSCMSGSAQPLKARHDAVVNTLHRFANLMGVVSLREPTDLCTETGKRPDLELHLPTGTLLTDVTISHPTAPSYRRRVAAHGAEAAVGDVRDAEKKDKYDDIADSNAMQFISFVLFSYGGWHNSAKRVLRKLAAAVEPACCLLSRQDWTDQLTQHIAVTMQRGNAAIMLHAAHRDQHGASRRPFHPRPALVRVLPGTASAVSAASLSSPDFPLAPPSSLPDGLATTSSASAAAADDNDMQLEAADVLGAVHDRPPVDAALACSTTPPAASPRRRSSLPAAADSDGPVCVLRPAAAAAMATAIAYSARAPHAVTAVAVPAPTSASPPSPPASETPSSRRAELTTTTPVPAAAHDGRQQGAVSATRNAGLTAAAPAQPPDGARLTDSSTLSAAPARRRSSLPAAAANDGDGDTVMLPVTAAAVAAAAHSARALPAVLDAAAAAASDAATAAAAVHDAVPDDASAMMTDAVPVTADAELCSGQPDLRAASAAQLESAGARLEADGEDADVRAMRRSRWRGGRRAAAERS